MAGTKATDRTPEFETEVQRGLLPDLEVVRRLGGGALSTVYLAREPALQRLVAVKVLHRRASRHTKSMARFRREARLLARVSHPNVVSIFRVGDLAVEIPYLVMRYIRGSDLAAQLLEQGRLEVEESCAVLGAVGAALTAVHAHGIVHRDVRPESVLCEQPGGRVLLADFGLAALLATEEESAERITTAGHIVTDLKYSAPEFLLGEEPTPSSDVYSLGVLAYYVLTGDGPYEASAVPGRVHSHLREAPVRLNSRGMDVPSGLQEVLDACLSKDPRDRPTASDAAHRFASLVNKRVDGAPVAAARAVTSGQVQSDSDPTLVLRVLGGLDLSGEGGRDASILRQPKRVALLAYLAVGPEGGFKRRDSLIGLFWPDADAESARHSLRQALYVLRREIGAEALRVRGDGEVGIDPGILACDAARFEILARSGQPAAAMVEYGGDLLPGFYVDDAPEFEHWLAVERVRLRRLAAQLCWNLVEEAVQGGDVTEAPRWAHQAVDLDPFDETALHRLIELLDALGDRAGALAAFDYFARRLAEEYAAVPSPETMALVQRVRSRER
ncbi:protein kinase [Gemmatimonadota bacterium]